MGCELLARPQGRWVLGLVVAAIPCSAHAEPYRLRADAIAQSQSPTGLLVLSAEDRSRPWLDVEGLLWAGGRPEAAGDVLVLAVRLRDVKGRGELRGGRLVVSTGAIRPVQIDGVSGLARAPWGTTVEGFAGSPVTPRFGERRSEFAGGGRIAQSMGSVAVAGFSYVQQRGHGEVDREEAGADLALIPARWLDIAARGAYNLQSPGVSEALASAAVRAGNWRIEGFASHRSPSRLLPATSLFSVLGDMPARSLGTTVRWKAAPRLDLQASGALQTSAGETGGNAWVRARLWLDDEGNSSVSVETRRQQLSTARWSGLRGIFSLGLGGGFRYVNELELVVPDDPVGSAVAWPWGLLALSWESRGGWEIAGAMEASSTPQYRYEMTALARLTRRWGSKTP